MSPGHCLSFQQPPKRSHLKGVTNSGSASHTVADVPSAGDFYWALPCTTTACGEADWQKDGRQEGLSDLALDWVINNSTQGDHVRWMTWCLPGTCQAGPGIQVAGLDTVNTPQPCA